jgi:hypothetical protein
MAGLFKRAGPAAAGSDSARLTLALVGDCRGWAVATDMLSQWRARRDLLPGVPSPSRFKRRRRAVMNAFHGVRLTVLRRLDWAADQAGAIDRLPSPVVKFQRGPASRGDGAAYGADFGRVPSKQQTLVGFLLPRLVTLNALILAFDLAPASAADLTMGAERWAEQTDRTVFGHKGYRSAQLAADLLATRGVRRLTLPRRKPKRHLPPAVCQLCNAVRQSVETVNGQVTQPFNSQVNPAHSVWGLCTRLLTKLTAPTVCLSLNRLLRNPDFLPIKSLAFPN